MEWESRQLDSLNHEISSQRTVSPALVTAPVNNPIHQCSVISDSMGVFELVVRVLEAPCSISDRILVEQMGKNLANVLVELARAKQETNCDTTRAELDRIELVTLL
jgi:hypothetical protein